VKFTKEVLANPQIPASDPFTYLNSMEYPDRMIGLNLSRAQADAAGYRDWIEDFCFIENEDAIEMSVRSAGGLRRGQRMSLSLSWHQKHIWKCPERTMELKSRQIGMSTGEAIKLYGNAKFEGRNGAVIAHDVKSAEYLFEKFERCWSVAAILPRRSWMTMGGRWCIW